MFFLLLPFTTYLLPSCLNMNFATIDVGSNSVLLLIATLTEEGQIRPLLEKAEITRLSEKINENNGQLTPDAMERTLKVLRKYTDLCHRNKVDRIVCIGTEALRRAQNAQEFVQKVANLCGFKLEIIPGSKEAELAYLSAMLDFGEKFSNLVVLDIGGGSTELIWQTEQNGDSAKLQTLSMKMGSVRLTEEFLKQDPVIQSEYSQMRQFIDEKLSSHLNHLQFSPKNFTLIGLAGTVITLSAIDQKLSPYDPNKIQGAVLQHASLKDILRKLKERSLEERKKMTGMEPKRADVLLAGASILDCVMEKLGSDHLIVSDRGIRYGLFYQRFLSA